MDKPWLPGPRKAYRFLNANLIDPKTGKTTPNTMVSISEGKIVEVTSMTTYTPTDEGEGHIAIDIEGKFLCPGLVDSHVHLTAVPGEIGLKATYKNVPESMINYRTSYLCKQMLMRGFTTARDCGGAGAPLKEAIREWLIPGPRLLVAGHALSQTGGHGDQRDAHNDDPTMKCCGGHRPGVGRLCDGVTGCMVAVRDELRKGADFIKIMAGGGVASPLNNLEHVQFLPEEIQAITRTAETFNTYVTCHAYTNRAMRHAVDNGVKGIEHGNFIDEDTAKYLAERNVYLTPTLVTYDVLQRPPFNVYLSDACHIKNQRVLKSGLESLRIADQANVVMCYGSDLLAGMHKFQSREFTMRAQVLSSLKVLQSATVNGARMMGLEDEVGQIKVGCYADVLVLNKSPLEDISILDEIQNILLVMKDGYVYRSRLPNVVGEIEERDQW